MSSEYAVQGFAFNPVYMAPRVGQVGTILFYIENRLNNEDL